MAVSLLGVVLSLFLLLHCCRGAGFGKAYYILFADDISASTWPSQYKEYSLFITQPQNITADTITKIHTDIPGSKVLAYWDFQNIPYKYGCSTGHVMGDRHGRDCVAYPSYKCGPGAYSTALQNMGFKKEYLLTQLFKNGTSTNICWYPGLGAWVGVKESVDVVVEFLSTWLRKVPFDGIYLDGTVNAAAFAKSIAEWTAPYPSFDSNGDGKPETLPEVVAQYQSWYPYFIHSLRKKLGDEAIIIGNSGGAISHPDLNGITVEMESCLDVQSCVNALQGQNAIGMSPAVSVLWLTHSEALPPAAQCAQVHKFQEMMNWVLAGTDFFDGSHIVCND